MDLNLSGKRAIVCGSTQGIGWAIAAELAKLGANVALMARDEHKLNQLVGELKTGHGQQHHFITADFSVPDNVRTAIEQYLIKENKVEILVNNTGGPAGGEAIEAKPDEFTSAFSQHLICNQILVQAVKPCMVQAGYGRIINVISTSVKAPIPGLGVSNTIRGAVANWSKTLSFELGGYGITVNNILPGATMTARLTSIIKNKAKQSGIPEDEVKNQMLADIPAARFAEAAEVANAAAFLASPAAGYINGINLPVDGGRLGNL